MLRNLLICLSCFLHFALFAQVPSVVISPLNPSVCSGNTITLTASTNAAPGATFLWMPGGATTPSIAVSPSTNTTYTCTVSSGAFSNSSSSTVTVNAIPTATMVVNGLTLSINASGPLTYLWPNGTTTQSTTAFQTGQICCWLTNLSGCSNSICVNYINPTLNYSIAGQDATINCNQNTNGYQLGTAPIAGHTYSWSPTSGLSNPNIANPIANPTVTTTYTLTDFDANGNTVVDQVTITVNTTPPTINAGPDQTVCQGSNVTLNATSNASPITWNNGVQNNIPFVANTPGSTTYTASVTGTNGCVATDNMVVLVNPQPQFSITASGPTTLCSGQSVTLCVPYQYPWTYAWSNASITNCITVSYPGTYCVFITDYLTGCSNMACIPVNIFNSTNAGLDATISCTQNTSGAQIGSAAVAGNTYSWSPATGLSNPNSPNPIAQPTTTTTYTLTATNAIGCTATDQVVVNVNTTPPTLNAGPDQTVCLGSNVTLNATSNASPITWNNGVQNNIPFIANTPGSTTYTASVTGTNGCVATDNMVVLVNPLPPVSITAAGSTSLCPGQSVTLCGPPGNTWGYSWCTGETTACITVTNPGTYCLSTYSFNGCWSNTAYIVINSAVLPIANAGPDATISCTQNTSGAQIGSAAIAGSTYSWSPTTGLSNSNSANPIAQPTATTTYTLTATNDSGCTATDQVVVSVNTTPPSIAIVANGSTTICPGASVVLSTTTAGLSYSWKKNGIPISNATSASFTVTQPGTYTLTGTTASGCISTSNSITISFLQATLSATGPTTICPGSYVVLQATIGTGYMYQWVKNGNAAINFNNNAGYSAISSGIYSVNILTPSGCLLSSNSIQVQVLPSPTASIIAAGSSTICSGSSVTLICSTTGNGLNYQWKKNTQVIVGATSSNLTVTQAGIYSLSISNAACPSNWVTSNSITITVNPSPSPSISASSLTISPGNTATLSTPLIANQSYQWQKQTNLFPFSIPGATSANYTTNVGASYRVRATNAYGCVGYSPYLTIVNVLSPETSAPKTCQSVSDVEPRIYPNPTARFLTIEIPEAELYQSIDVLDLNMRSIQHFESTDLQMQIDLSFLTPGTYWVRIGTHRCLPFVKN